MSERINHNPDVLSCLANLSNDEVLTPPDVANAMLDMLPQEIFRDPNARFLDPACKSGIFLREIAKRLLKGLKDSIPDQQERIDHIFQKQLFGIAITELTSLLSRRSLYCSKHANSIYSVTTFENSKGNIRYTRNEHEWNNENKCIYCGVTKEKFGRSYELESYAYEFIHTIRIKELLKMKFDLIISNPPYQLDDGGSGRSARPIYQLFIEQAKKLKPRYLSMIIPSRWFSGGKGLDEFRSTMLRDAHIRRLIDFENFKDVFPGVDLAGGACYFLWDRDNPGPCLITNKSSKEENTATRKLNEFDTFIRNNKALEIVRKITKWNLGNEVLSSYVSPRKPFGIPSNYEPQNQGIPCWFIQKIGYKYALPVDVNDSKGFLDKWKFLIPAAPIAGQTDFTKPVGFFYDGNTRIAEPGACCTETWLVAGAFHTREETENFKSYLLTKIVRFLLLQTVVSQHISIKSFAFIPAFSNYDQKFTDEYLCKLWGISEEEWQLIDSKIKNIGVTDE